MCQHETAFFMAQKTFDSQAVQLYRLMGLEGAGAVSYSTERWHEALNGKVPQTVCHDKKTTGFKGSMNTRSLSKKLS